MTNGAAPSDPRRHDAPRVTRRRIAGQTSRPRAPGAGSSKVRVTMENLQGTTLGRYHLIALLGRGNRASVYQARPRDGGDAVTVRVFDRDLTAEPQFAARFRQHAGAIAAIRHPHLLPVIDHDEQDGLAYLVRPYIAGGAMRRLLGSPIALAETLRLLRPIADALDHAHAAGFVHGDVKPGNILLPPGGEVLLADLGIAEILPRGNSLLMAATGRSYGTPEYLSPEQAHALTLDGQTDQYALGVIVYEALVGRPPFRAERLADTARTVAARHITTPPPKPRALNPAIAPGVEQALLRALDKDPQRRFPSCGAFMAALAVADPFGIGLDAGPALPAVAGAHVPVVPPGEAFLDRSDTAPFHPPAATDPLILEPVSARLGTILLPSRPAEIDPCGEVEGDPLERLAAHHAAEIQVLTTYFEQQLAQGATTLREREDAIALVHRQLAEATERREQLAAEVAALRRELQARHPGKGEVAAPSQDAPASPARAGVRFLLLDPLRHNLPQGTSFTLSPGAIVGRHTDCTIQLDDAFVSGHHARLTCESDAWWVTDLGTRNGTYVNDAAITAPTRLDPGDVLRFGRVRVSVQ